MRLALPVRMLLISGLTLRFHLHHQFHGPPIDYAGVAAAAAASWIGVPGPGEPVLIAAGVLAANHKLDIVSVVGAAWVGAAAGGIGGWLLGIRAGRGLLTAPGPLRRLRLKAVAQGDRIFERYAVLAILFAPSWISGIHRVRTALYLPVNALGAGLWASGIGLGAYYIGPTVVEFADDLGLVLAIGLGILIAVVLGGELLRRRRRDRRSGVSASEP